ncbi:MAG: hypothetical protein PVG79_10110 [Gemmatimonadales bacterium]|jgi:hypothetical protein
MRTTITAIMCVAVALAACLDTGEDRVLSVQSTGTVQGSVFFDVNDSGDLDEGDTPFAGAEVGLASAGAIVAVSTATSDGDGLWTIPRVDVATYDVVVDSASVGDTAQVFSIDPQHFTLTPDGTVTIVIGVAARQAP